MAPASPAEVLKQQEIRVSGDTQKDYQKWLEREQQQFSMERGELYKNDRERYYNADDNFQIPSLDLNVEVRINPTDGKNNAMISVKNLTATRDKWKEIPGFDAQGLANELSKLEKLVFDNSDSAQRALEAATKTYVERAQSLAQAKTIGAELKNRVAETTPDGSREVDTEKPDETLADLRSKNDQLVQQLTQLWQTVTRLNDQYGANGPKKSRAGGLFGSQQSKDATLFTTTQQQIVQLEEDLKQVRRNAQTRFRIDLTR